MTADVDAIITEMGKGVDALVAEMARGGANVTNAIVGRTARRIPTHAMIQALRAAHGLVAVAAESLGCHPTTIYRRAARVAAVREAIEEGRAELVDLAEAKLYEAVEAGQAWAIMLTLKTLGKSRGYSERQEQLIEQVVVKLEWST